MLIPVDLNSTHSYPSSWPSRGWAELLVWAQLRPLSPSLIRLPSPLLSLSSPSPLPGSATALKEEERGLSLGGRGGGGPGLCSSLQGSGRPLISSPARPAPTWRPRRGLGGVRSPVGGLPGVACSGDSSGRGELGDPVWHSEEGGAGN